MTNKEIKKNEVETSKTETPPSPSKPDYLPKKFWDEETQTMRLEEMTKSYKELEKKLSSVSQELKESKALESEKPTNKLEDKNLLNSELAPSSPDEYLKEINLDLITISPEINKILFDAKYSINQVQIFYGILEQFVMPEILDLYNDMKSLHDLEKLEDYFGGEEKFSAISRQLNAWANKSLETNTYSNLSKDFQGVIAMYKMMQEESEKGSSSITASSPSYKSTKEEKENNLKAMMKNPSYWRDKNPEYRNKVEEGFKELYPS